MELKRKSIRLKDYNYSKEGYYYITICIKNRKEMIYLTGDEEIRRLQMAVTNYN